MVAVVLCVPSVTVRLGGNAPWMGSLNMARISMLPLEGIVDGSVMAPVGATESYDCAAPLSEATCGPVAKSAFAFQASTVPAGVSLPKNSRYGSDHISFWVQAYRLG